MGTASWVTVIADGRPAEVVLCRYDCQRPHPLTSAGKMHFRIVPYSDFGAHLQEDFSGDYLKAKPWAKIRQPPNIDGTTGAPVECPSRHGHPVIGAMVWWGSGRRKDDASETRASREKIAAELKFSHIGELIISPTAGLLLTAGAPPLPTRFRLSFQALITQWRIAVGLGKNALFGSFSG